MNINKIRPERIFDLNNKEIISGNKFIVYRMQSSIRVSHNLALYKAIDMAVKNKFKLIVIFHLDLNFPEANYRHFSFLIEGLKEVGEKLASMGILFKLLYGSFQNEITQLFGEMAAMVTDMGYLRYHRDQIKWLSDNLPCKLIGVEDNLCVPIESASHKQEWSARTIRPKIMNKLNYFINDAMVDIPDERLFDDYPKFDKEDTRLINFIDALRKKSDMPENIIIAGEEAAKKTLNNFIVNKLPTYDSNRNNPEKHATSHLSPYLHFGMISPLHILNSIIDQPNTSSFIEELVVRRELAHNFIWFNNQYDSYNSLPDWCQKTLSIHKSDKRPILYTLTDLAKMNTHDDCWNSAMNEMVKTGYMENTMRMYWGKKIIEWSETPEEAFEAIAFLNNKYELDGRDANSWTGIAWCFGLHDRPWIERPIFGTVRYMNQNGLLRKYNMKVYINENKL